MCPTRMTEDAKAQEVAESQPTEDGKREVDPLECCICYDKDKVLCLLSCSRKHCVCAGCFAQIETCPLCREVIPDRPIERKQREGIPVPSGSRRGRARGNQLVMEDVSISSVSFTPSRGSRQARDLYGPGLGGFLANLLNGASFGRAKPTIDPCSICGARVKYPDAPRHVASRRHQRALVRIIGPANPAPSRSAASASSCSADPHSRKCS